jgi:hypothetical protein
VPTPETIELEGNQHLYSPNPGIPALTLHAKTGHTGPLIAYIDATGALINPAPVVNAVAEYAAKGDGSTDNATAIQSAITSLTATGGVVYLPPGHYKTSAAWTFPFTTGQTSISPFAAQQSNIWIVGAGRGATTIERTGNTRIFDFSGTDSATYKIRGGLRDLTLHGGNTAGWTTELVRAYYAQHVEIDRVNFLRTYGPGLVGLQLWDSYIRACRFDGCGTAAAGYYALTLRNTEQGVSSGFGFSSGNTNNIWVTDTVIENNRGGGVYFDGRDKNGAYTNTQLNQCWFINTKIEQTGGTPQLLNPLVVVEHCEDITFTNLALSGKDLAAEASGTPPNFMEISQSRNVFSPNIQVETVESSSAAIRAGIALKGSNSNVRLRVTANVQTTNKPTVALVEYSGSNNNDCDVDAAYINNAGSAALFSGGPTRGIAKDRNYYLNGGTGLIRETYPVGGVVTAERPLTIHVYECGCPAGRLHREHSPSRAPRPRRRPRGSRGAGRPSRPPPPALQAVGLPMPLLPNTPMGGPPPGPPGAPPGLGPPPGPPGMGDPGLGGPPPLPFLAVDPGQIAGLLGQLSQAQQTDHQILDSAHQQGLVQASDLLAAMQQQANPAAQAAMTTPGYPTPPPPAGGGY